MTTKPRKKHGPGDPPPQTPCESATYLAATALEDILISDIHSKRRTGSSLCYGAGL